MNYVLHSIKNTGCRMLAAAQLAKRPYVKINEKEIVFVADFLEQRIAKISYALRRKGYSTILLLSEKGAECMNSTDKNFFNRTMIFKTKEEAYSKCLHYRPLAYHLFSRENIEEYAPYLIRRKASIGKIVYDQYDIYRGLSGNTNEMNEKREKYCFENADGICCRSFETQYLKYRYKYQFKGKRIFFLDYCWGRFHYEPKEKNEQEGLQFVYAGQLISPRSRSYREKMEWEGFRYIAEEAAKQNSYFTLIPSVACGREDMIRFIGLNRDNEYVKIKKTMKIEDLIRYESTMDYGIDCVEFQSKMDEYERQFGAVYDYRAKARYSSTNKYFDYIDAGIPAIYGRKDELFGKYLARYGGAVPCSLEELPEKMEQLKKDRNRNKQRAREARKHLSIHNQIDRLIAFYHEI